MALNFDVSPYYDDFDSSKNYHRILFKPGYAVQARELTQSQTILQDQISKFGSGVFADGSKVSGGNITIDTNIVTAKLTSDTSSQISDFVNLYAVGTTSQFISQVVDVDINNNYIMTKAANINNNKSFAPNEIINFYTSKIDAFNSLSSTVVTGYSANTVTQTSTIKTNVSGTYLDNNLTIDTSGINIGDQIVVSSANNFTATVVSITDNNHLVINNVLSNDITSASANVTSFASVNALEVNVDAGVWFTNGMFVENSYSSIIPQPTNLYPSVVVGFEIDETVVDSYSDASLLDPAIGASNYQAPGADRYQVNLNLVYKPYVSDQTVANLTTNKFIELVRINQGVVEDIKNVPILTDISASIAQSVYDITGNFIVNPFKLIINNNFSSAKAFSSKITAGKAFLNGYEVQHIAPTPYVIEKGRDTENLFGVDFSTYYGNYTKVNNLHGSIINFQAGTTVELHNVASTNVSSSTKIGTANIRNFDYDSGSLNATIYKTFLSDIALSNNAFSNVLSMVVPGSGSNYTQSALNFAANTVSPTSLSDPSYSTLIFPLPQNNISNTSNISYTTRRYFNVPSFTNGVATINCGSTEQFKGGPGTVSSSEAQLNFAVVTTSASGNYSAGSFIPMDQANVSITINNTGTPQATINIAGGFNGSATIYATIDVTNDSPKNKVLHTNQSSLVSANTLYAPIDTGYSDIYNFKGVYELGNTIPYMGAWSSSTSYSANTAALYTDGQVYLSLTNSNVNHNPSTSSNNWSVITNNINNYFVDNGQRDSLYDHGKITNISGSPKGNVVVIFDYFTHSGGQGYFTLNSYPVDYSNIPSYSSHKTGKTYQLRDVVDFRPRRTDGIGATSLDTYQIPAPFELSFIYLNYGYYLGRIDKIVLYPNGQFKTIRGVPSYINPRPPADISEALTLFTLTIPPYTFNSTDILNVPSKLRRYTMRDIGLLDNRISNLENYTSLSILENQVTATTLTSANGQNILFNNGFLVDTFTGHGVGDVKNPDYLISIDPNAQIARPTFLSQSIPYDINYSQGAFNSNTAYLLGNGKQNNYLVENNNIITFSYNEYPLVFQNVATEIINVNPFNVINFIGNAKLSPSSDVWYDTTISPIINVVNDDQQAWLNASGNNTTVVTSSASSNTAYNILFTGPYYCLTSTIGSQDNGSGGLLQYYACQSINPIGDYANGVWTWNTLYEFYQWADANGLGYGLNSSNILNTSLSVNPMSQSWGFWPILIKGSNNGPISGGFAEFPNQTTGYFPSGDDVYVVNQYYQLYQQYVATQGHTGIYTSTGNGSQWNDWQFNWSGEPTDTIISPTNTVQVSRDTQAIQQSIASQGINAALQNGPIQVSSTSTTISESIIPVARSIPVYFELNGMSPYTLLHTFINGVPVDGYVSPGPTSSDRVVKIDILNGGSGYVNGNNQTLTITGQSTSPAIATANVVGGSIVSVNLLSTGYGYSSTPSISLASSNTSTASLVANTVYNNSVPLVTDVNGYASGYLTIPDDNNVNFASGTLKVEFTDKLLNPLLSQTYATATFYSMGTLDTVQTTVTSVRPPIVTPKPQVTNITNNPVSVSTPNDDTPTYSPTQIFTYTPDSNIPSTGTLGINGTLTEGSGWEESYSRQAQDIAYSLTGDTTVATNVMGIIGPGVLDQIYNAVVAANGGQIPSTAQMQTSMTDYVQNAISTNNYSQDQKVLNSTLSNINSSSINATSSGLISNQGSVSNINTNCLNGVDPLSQNFFVDAQRFPNGVFLSSVDLFFATKDASIPVSVRVRPTVNGYPDASNDIPGSIVYLNPNKVNIPSVNAFNGIGPSTTFTFDHPIYLAPGQYSIMVASDSNNYNVYASKLGQPILGTTTLLNQLNYTWSLFKSQNASTWVAAPGETLCFTLRVCNFAGGSASFDITSKKTGQFNYDLMQLTTRDQTFNSLDSITYRALTKDATTGTQSSSINVFANKNYNFANRQSQINSGDIIIRPTMTNNDITGWTSPVIDMDRMSTVLVQNIIKPYDSANTVSELSGGFYNGGSIARYITKRVTLNNGFDATGLTVYVDVNRQPGTKIEVYYKVLNQYDSNNFDDNSYTLMQPLLPSGGGLPYTGPSDWTEDTYQALNINYNDINTGSTYNDFITFAIKVVMYSSNPAIVPQIKNFRAIATA